MDFHTFGPGLAIDKTTTRGIPTLTAQLADAETGDPVQAYSMEEDPQPINVTTNRDGFFTQFQVPASVRRLRMTFGTLTLEDTAWELVTEAADRAEAALLANQETLAAAEEAAQQARDAASLVNAPADDAVARLVKDAGSKTRAGLDAAYKGRVIRSAAPPALEGATAYMWEGAPHASASVKLVGGEVVARNHAANPSFEQAVAEWPVSRATLESVPRTGLLDELGPSGYREALLTATTAGTSFAQATTLLRPPVVPGEWVTVSALAAPVEGAVSVGMLFYKANGTSYRSEGWSAVSTKAGKLSHTMQVPSDAAFVAPALRVYSASGTNPDSGESAVFDSVMCAIAATSQAAQELAETYFDGDTPGSLSDTIWVSTLTGVAHTWDGAHWRPINGPDLLADIKPPLVIAHRGAARVNPEHSMEAYEDVTTSGFPPEQDVQFLADGTPVICHDSTVDRTMEGVTGPVSSLTLDQWRAARIKNPIPGGRTGTPTTFADVLDRFGGRILLVPEVKPGATPAQVQQCIDMVKARGLDRAVLMQSFDRAAVTQMQDAGLACIYLFGAMPAESPADMYAAGIRWVGPSKARSTAELDSLAAAGLKVIPYSMQTRAHVRALPASVYGYFSDDPWDNSGRLQAEIVPRWTRGEAWPARRVYGGKNGLTDDYSSFVRMEGGGLRLSDDGERGLWSVDLSHLTGGPIDRPLVMTARVLFLRRSGYQGTNVGFTLYRNTNPDALFQDQATPGQNGFTFALRRNGNLEGWHYTNGAKAEALGAAVTGPEVVAENQMAWATIRLEMATSWIGFTHVESGRQYSGNNDMAGPFIPMLRSNSQEAIFYDVSVTQYSA